MSSHDVQHKLGEICHKQASQPPEPEAEEAVDAKCLPTDNSVLLRISTTSGTQFRRFYRPARYPDPRCTGISRLKKENKYSRTTIVLLALPKIPTG
jgi:hypothetical protein